MDVPGSMGSDEATRTYLAAEPVLQDSLSSLAERVGAARVEAGEHVLPHRVAVDAVHGGTVHTGRIVNALHGSIAGGSKHVGLVGCCTEKGMPLRIQ